MSTVLSPARTSVAGTATSSGPRRRVLDARWVRLGGGALVLGVLVQQLGAEPFAEGVRGTDPLAVLVAVAVTAGTTWACALRWSLVSARLGKPLPLAPAVRAYYRSQLVNAVLPGGVVGDVHRSVRHGWRSVVGERGAGQLVQLTLIGAVALPGWWRAPAVAAFVALVVAGGLITLLSALSTCGHLVVFLLAASSVGVDLPWTTLVVVGALVLLGSSVPLNVAGWGPREGVAVWAFTSYGVSATAGLAVSVCFGVLATLAVLPGVLFLGSDRG